MFFNICLTPHEVALPLQVVYLINKPHWVIAIRFLCFLAQFGKPDTSEPEARERLADYAHAAWSGWMQYMFKKSTYHQGRVIIPVDLVERWTRQMNTPYAELPESEKESDRLEADRILEIVDT
jgi:hypothetical protein